MYVTKKKRILHLMCACFISSDVLEWTTMTEADVPWFVIYKVQGDPRQEQIPEVKLKSLP